MLLETLNKEVERQKRKIADIEMAISKVEKELGEDLSAEKRDISDQKEFLEDPGLQIAIVGTIKAGKSTFINALFEDYIASTEVTPETASLTKFRYSDQNRLIVKFYNTEEWNKLWKSVEESENRSKNRIFREEYDNLHSNEIERDYVGKKDEIINVSNIKELKEKVKKYTSKQSREHYFVKELIVELNNQRVPKNVTIVDTPGLNDVIEYRSNITRDYIKRANVVIVCVNSTNSLTNEDYLTLIKVFENAGDDLYKVIILGTKIDMLNKTKEDWDKLNNEWKNLMKDYYKDSYLLDKNIIGVSSFIHSNILDMQKTSNCDNEEAILAILKLAKNYGINASLSNFNSILENADKIKECTNIDKVHSLMTKDILSKGVEIAMGDLERRYNSMITNINNKARELNLANEESRRTLDMDVEEKEAFKLAKNKEIELIEKTMDGLTKAFEDIKTKWLEQNEKLKKAIRS